MLAETPQTTLFSHTHTPSTLREMRTKFHRVQHHYFHQATFSVIMSEDPCPPHHHPLEMPGQWLVAICHYTGCEGDCFTPHFASSANTRTNDIRKLSMCKARMAWLIRKPTQERFTVMTQKWFVEKPGAINCESLFAVRYYVCLWAATGHLHVPAWNPRGWHCQMFGLISMAINTTLPQDSQLSNKAVFLENGMCIKQTQKASTFFKKSINGNI